MTRAAAVTTVFGYRVMRSTKGTRIRSISSTRGVGTGARAGRRRSTRMMSAGNSVIIESHASRIDVPAMKPSSWIPRNSVAVST